MHEQYKGIIFDFNGTLFFDSEKHLEAWRDFSAKLRGTPFTDEEMRHHMFGRTNKDIIAYAIGKEPSAELVEKLAKEKEGLYRECCKAEGDNCKLAPFAEDFLDYLKENNIQRTIATMSEWDNVEFYIEHFKLEKWFDLDKIVYSDGKIKGKPAPDIYEIAAKKLNLPPEECVVVEDAVSGIESAHAAGIGKIVAIASMEPVELYKKMPAVNTIIKDFHDFDKILSKKELIKQI
ncbi:HAD family phosphatase [bacterium]|nr:HAD family phosphatase [bacterium]